MVCVCVCVYVQKKASRSEEVNKSELLSREFGVGNALGAALFEGPDSRLPCTSIHEQARAPPHARGCRHNFETARGYGNDGTIATIYTTPNTIVYVSLSLSLLAQQRRASDFDFLSGTLRRSPCVAPPHCRPVCCRASARYVCKSLIADVDRTTPPARRHTCRFRRTNAGAGHAKSPTSGGAYVRPSKSNPRTSVSTRHKSRSSSNSSTLISGKK